MRNEVREDVLTELLGFLGFVGQCAVLLMCPNAISKMLTSPGQGLILEKSQIIIGMARVIPCCDNYGAPCKMVFNRIFMIFSLYAE